MIVGDVIWTHFNEVPYAVSVDLMIDLCPDRNWELLADEVSLLFAGAYPSPAPVRDWAIFSIIWMPYDRPSIPTTYTLTYNPNNGTGGPAAQTGIAAGTVVTLATTNLPTRAGYTFKGWAAASTGTAVITSVTVNADTTVYAVWEKNEEQVRARQGNPRHQPQV